MQLALQLWYYLLFPYVRVWWNKIQQAEQPTLEEAIEKLRSEIVITHSKTEQTSLNGFDVLVNQIKGYAQMINNQTDEIKRLQELCKKNNIDFERKKPQNPEPEPKKPDTKK